MQPKCSRGCRMVPIVEGLWLCDHASYGRLVDMKGAVADGRAMLERAGGFEHLRRRLDDEAEEAKARRRAATRPVQRVREG